MGELANITFTGDSGSNYQFTTYTLDTIFNNVGAVYIFTRRVVAGGEATHARLYIGETGELANRISNHEKWPCLENHDVNCICVHVDNNENSRLEKETDLIRAYSTPCNDQ